MYSTSVYFTQESLFHQALVELGHRIQCECGYRPNLLFRAIAERGAVAAAKKWINDQNHTDGFIESLSRKHPDLTVEAVVVGTDWGGLFTAGEIERAKQRLASVGYNFGAEASRVAV